MGLITHFFSLLTLMTLNASAGQGQPIPYSLQNAYQDLLKLKIDSTQYQLNFLADRALKHPFSIYVNNLAHVGKLLIAGTTKDFEQCKNQEKIILENVDNLPDDDPWKGFLASEVKLQWAFVKMKFGNYFSAFWSLRKAYQINSDAMEASPDFEPLQKTSAELNIILGSVPSKYQWILSLFGMDGNVADGAAKLEALFNAHHLFSLECGLITALSNSYLLENEQKATSMMAQMWVQNQDNLLVQFVYANVLLKDAQGAKAIEVISEILSPASGYIEFPVMNYLRGEVYLQCGDYQNSRHYYTQFLKAKPGKNLIKDAWFKSAICYWLQGNNKMAEHCLDGARLVGHEETEADQYAAYMAGEKRLPNQQLLKARYFTDGGYYDKADSILSNVAYLTLANHYDTTEYFYRLARLEHRTNEIERSQSDYLKVIDFQGTRSWYFAPNSCLQLGLIYRQQRRNIEAKRFFEKVFNYKDYPYEGSISKKAKLAIETL